MRLRGRSCYPLVLLTMISCSVTIEAANPRIGKISVPVMTPLTVRLDEAVNVKSAANGMGFTALIKEPVKVDGVVVIPANSSAAGLLSKGNSDAAEVQLNSLFVNGRMYRITTSPITCTQKTNLRAGTTMTFYLVLSLTIAR